MTGLYLGGIHARYEGVLKIMEQRKFSLAKAMEKSSQSICRSSVDRWWSIAGGRSLVSIASRALLWNSLPENIRAIRSIGQFKKEINRALETFDSHSAIT